MTRLGKFRRLLLIGVFVLIAIVIAVVYMSSQPTQPSLNPADAKAIIFDFDTGSPLLAQTFNTPFNQTSNGVTAHFSSPSDPAAFAVESQESNSLKLSQFSGKYLVDNKPSRDILDIKLDTQVIAVNFTFATVEHQGGAITIPSDILLTAYRDTRLVGSTRAYGSFSGDSYPQGTLTFGSGEPFNWLRVSVPSQTSGTTDFLIDNISVSVVG